MSYKAELACKKKLLTDQRFSEPGDDRVRSSSLCFIENY